jgi:hypothetical protein
VEYAHAARDRAITHMDIARLLQNYEQSQILWAAQLQQ